LALVLGIPIADTSFSRMDLTDHHLAGPLGVVVDRGGRVMERVVNFNNHHVTKKQSWPRKGI